MSSVGVSFLLAQCEIGFLTRERAGERASGRASGQQVIANKKCARNGPLRRGGRPTRTAELGPRALACVPNRYAPPGRARWPVARATLALSAQAPQVERNGAQVVHARAPSEARLCRLVGCSLRRLGRAIVSLAPTGGACDRATGHLSRSSLAVAQLGRAHRAQFSWRRANEQIISTPPRSQWTSGGARSRQGQTKARAKKKKKEKRWPPSATSVSQSGRLAAKFRDGRLVSRARNRSHAPPLSLSPSLCEPVALGGDGQADRTRGKPSAGQSKQAQPISRAL